MNQIIIGLVGEACSGKDTVASYLESEYGANLCRFANPIKDTLRIYFDKLSREDQQWLYLAFKERFGDDILCRAMRKRLSVDDSKIIVINGLRMLCDYDFIKSYPKSHILYVTADEKVRWERSKRRKEKTDDDVPFDEFRKMEETETEINIPKIGAKADKKIVNYKDTEYLLGEAEKFMTEIGAEKLKK